MTSKYKIAAFISVFLAASIACTFTNFLNELDTGSEDSATPSEPTNTPVIFSPVRSDNPDEPVFVSGTVPFTSPFFLDSASEPFVLLEDQAGFVRRDKEFIFALAGQSIGPVEQIDDNTMSYSLALPAVPQGTLVDVDNDGKDETGLMVFAVAYWSNIWGGPFLEEREGHGWSTAYATTLTDPDRDSEIIGGYLLIWSPDDEQGFPSGFGDDNLLFTADDPIQDTLPGYSIVDLNQDPFTITKESHPTFELTEGSGAVKDFSEMDYGDAFEAMFERVAIEYPFTVEKGIDWDALHAEFGPRAADARNGDDFYRALRDFTLEIPDSHVGLSFNADVFFEENGGSFGLVLDELSDGRVIVIEVLPGTSGAQEGIQVGAEIITWDGQPVSRAIDQQLSYFGPYSTSHAEREDKLLFITRQPPGTNIDIQYRNPGSQSTTSADITADVEYDSLFASIPSFNFDPIGLPIEGFTLENGLAYIEITTFSDDYNLMAQVWERHIEELIENEIPGLILDLRTNGGGSGGLAMNFVGYFFEDEIEVARRSYYNYELDEFEYREFPTTIKPAPLFYEGPIAVLIGPDCISACEGFAYWLTQNQRAVIVGHFPSAGAFGEVGRGQYDMPEELSMQFPTGRPETMDGQILIEGVGVELDIVVPVTYESALDQIDTVLEAAIDRLFDLIN